MFRFHGCPKCQGDLYLERNEFGESEVYCVQCGFRKYQGQGALINLAAQSRIPKEKMAA